MEVIKQYYLFDSMSGVMRYSNNNNKEILICLESKIHKMNESVLKF